MIHPDRTLIYNDSARRIPVYLRVQGLIVPPKSNEVLEVEYQELVENLLLVQYVMLDQYLMLIRYLVFDE